MRQSKAAYKRLLNCIKYNTNNTVQGPSYDQSQEGSEVILRLTIRKDAKV